MGAPGGLLPAKPIRYPPSHLGDPPDQPPGLCGVRFEAGERAGMGGQSAASKRRA